jgi:hypothetical protein
VPEVGCSNAGAEIVVARAGVALDFVTIGGGDLGAHKDEKPRTAAERCGKPAHVCGEQLQQQGPGGDADAEQHVAADKLVFLPVMPMY